MSTTRLLIVDDEDGILEVIADTLCDLPETDIVLESASSRAASALATTHFDLLITDLRMPEPDGVALLRLAHQHDPDLPVLVLTAYPSIDTAVDTMKLGATDYLTKPFVPSELLDKVKQVLRESESKRSARLRRRRHRGLGAFDDIVGVCPAMSTVFDTIQRVAEAMIDVLITGDRHR